MNIYSELEHFGVVEFDYQMKDGMLVLDTQSSLIGCALRE
jgi:hypothetical protein